MPAPAKTYVDICLRRFAAEQHFFAFGLAALEEVKGPVDAPESADAQCDVRLLPTHTGDRERPDKVEEHDHQVRQQPKNRDYHVLKTIEGMVLFEGNHRDPAGDHVEQER